jgi:hypothetical protein
MDFFYHKLCDGKDGRPVKHTHTTKRGNRQMELPLSYRDKLRNPGVRQKRVKIQMKSIRLLKTLKYH